MKARERIKEAADDAANYLVQWLADDAVDKRLRVQIAQDLLDRAGISSKQTVDVEIRKFEQLAESGALLIDLPEPEQIGAGNRDIVDAEVVEESGRDWVERVDGPSAPPRRENVRFRGRRSRDDAHARGRARPGRRWGDGAGAGQRRRDLARLSGAG